LSLRQGLSGKHNCFVAAPPGSDFGTAVLSGSAIRQGGLRSTPLAKVVKNNLQVRGALGTEGMIAKRPICHLEGRREHMAVLYWAPFGPQAAFSIELLSALGAGYCCHNLPLALGRSLSRRCECLRMLFAFIFADVFYLSVVTLHCNSLHYILGQQAAY
jgi:hypothetical protein